MTVADGFKWNSSWFFFTVSEGSLSKAHHNALLPFNLEYTEKNQTLSRILLSLYKIPQF